MSSLVLSFAPINNKFNLELVEGQESRSAIFGQLISFEVGSVLRRFENLKSRGAISDSEKYIFRNLLIYMKNLAAQFCAARFHQFLENLREQKQC